jgi:hypothetical protein
MSFRTEAHCKFPFVLETCAELFVMFFVRVTTEVSLHFILVPLFDRT